MSIYPAWIIYLAWAVCAFWILWTEAKRSGIRPRRVAGVFLILALVWPVTLLAALLYKFFNFLSEDINAHDD